MSKKYFRHKSLVYASLAFFGLFLVSNSFSSAMFQTSQEWEQELQAGIDLYNEGQFSEAVQHFNRVLSLTEEASVVTTVHYNLSICHFYSENMDAAQESIRNLLRLEPAREAPDGFPAKYQKLYSKVKKELSKEAARMTKKTLQEQETQDTQYRTKKGEPKKKKSKILLIAGGAVLAATVATIGIFALSSNTGSIQCNSTPAGASVLLNGSSTGQVTPCTIDDVEPGTHTVDLALDGYFNYQQSVNVEKRKTATVNSVLTPHTITISSPEAHAVWVKGNTYTITWNIDSSLNLQNIPFNTFSNSAFASSSQLRRISPAFSRSASGKETLDRMLRQSRAPASKEQRNIPSVIEFGSEAVERGLHDRLDLMMRGSGLSSMIQQKDGFLSDARFQNRSHLNTPGRKPTALANVTIDLYKGGGKVFDIISNTPNNGSYTFQAPGDEVANAADFKVRISASTDPSVFGESDYFWVTHTGTLNATSNPTGAAIYWDGYSTSEVTDSTIVIPVGNQTVKYTRNLFTDYETSVNILKDQTTDLHKALDPDTFFEDFSDNQAQFWTPLIGSANWEIRDSVYRFIGTQSIWEQQINYYKAGSAKFYGNFTYELVAERISGYPYVVGITIGIEAEHNKLILLDVEPPTHYYSIWYLRAQGADWGTLTDWTHFNKINATGLNDLKIVRIGNSLYFYINEYEVAVHTLSYLKDWVEVGLWGYVGPGDIVQFDNIGMTLNSGSASPGITRAVPPPSEVIYRKDVSPLYSPGSKKK